MNEVVKQDGPGKTETMKLVAAIVIALAGVFAFYVLRGEQANWIRWLVFAGGLLVGGTVFAFSQHGRDARKFALDARIELYKVFWPTRDETLKTTLVVFIFVVIMALFFWIVDAFLAWATRSILGSGPGA